ncbi:MAG: general secretion pathway protein GspB [Gammaproteobacteria bacterium]
MSFILDALKKSARERESSVTAKLNAAPTEAKKRSLRWHGQLLLLFFLLANLIAVIALLSRNNTDEQPRSAATTLRQPEVRESPPASQPDVRSLAGEASAAARRSVTPTTSSPTLPNTPNYVASTFPVAPMFSELPANLRQELGPLHVDAHAFSTERSERFVLINLKRYQEGTTLSSGATVRQITPEGVILEFRGQEFFLSRN